MQQGFHFPTKFFWQLIQKNRSKSSDDPPSYPDRYYIDIRIYGVKKRIRRSLGTSVKAEALELYKQEKDRILAEHHRKEIRLEDFITKYLEYAKSAKPASASQEEAA